MMLSFFPTPRPDELLYSILARYHTRSTNISPKASLVELFGSTTVTATFDLPSNLESLVSNLPMMSAYTTESLMERHTLYPLYAPFLPPERDAVIADSMRNHFHGDIHTRIGVMAGAVPTYSYFRFCPVCLRGEIEEYGEPYWHRVHQITGVLICPSHRVWLQNSTVKTVGENKHEFLSADEENCSYKPTAIKYPAEIFNKLIALAQDIETLINLSLKSKTGEWYRNQYQRLLISKDLGTESGRIRQKEFLQEFEKFYGTEFLRAVHSSIEIDGESNWLSEIVRKHRKVFHPVRHLLLIRFLGQNVEDFFLNDQSVKPFGNGPWICFNGASDHYLKKVIKTVSVLYSSDIKKLIGTFSCQCGFVYSTSNPAKNQDGKLRFGKIKSFGSIWEQRLEKLLVEEKVSFRKASRDLKVDTKTIINHAKRMNLISASKTLDNEKTVHSSNGAGVKKEVNREIWMSLQKSKPSLSRTVLRQIRPDTYVWLYRHDRNWLRTNSPAKKKIAYVNKRIDWSERDGKTLDQVRKAVEQIFENAVPVRITISAIGKIINMRALLEKHLERLPRTATFLAANIESVEEFQIRRIAWAVQNLSESGKPIKVWRIMRLAGIKKNCSANIIRVINEYINSADEYLYIRRKTGS